MRELIVSIFFLLFTNSFVIGQIFFEDDLDVSNYLTISGFSNKNLGILLTFSDKAGRLKVSNLDDRLGRSLGVFIQTDVTVISDTKDNCYL